MTPRSGTGTCGTSSETFTCCCPDDPRGFRRRESARQGALGRCSQVFSLLHGVWLHSRRRAPRGVVVVANSSAIGSSSALRSIPPDGRSRRPRSTGHALVLRRTCSPPLAGPPPGEGRTRHLGVSGRGQVPLVDCTRVSPGAWEPLRGGTAGCESHGGKNAFQGCYFVWSCLVGQARPGPARPASHDRGGDHIRGGQPGAHRAGRAPHWASGAGLAV